MSARPADRDLVDLLFVLWSHRYTLLVAIGVAVASAVGLSLLIPATYRATATLVVTDAKMPATAGEQRPDGRVYSDTYAALLTSESVAAQTIGELGSERLGGLTAAQLAGRLTVRPVPNTLLITVSFEDTSAERAASIVNSHVVRVVEMSRAMSTANLSDTRDYLQAQVAAAQTELADRETRLQKVKAEVRFEESTARLKSLLELRGELEGHLAEAEQESAKSSAEAETMRKALDGSDRLVTLKRSVIDDPAVNGALAAGQSGSAQQRLGLELQAQEVDPMHALTEPALVAASAAAAGATRRSETVRRQLRSNETEVRRLERDLAEKSGLLAAATRDYDLAKDAYESFAKSFESARITVRAQVAELKLVSPATPEPRPVGSRIAINVAVAVAASAILGAFLVLFADHLRNARMPPAVDVQTAAGAPPTFTR